MQSCIPVFLVHTSHSGYSTRFNPIGCGKNAKTGFSVFEKKNIRHIFISGEAQAVGTTTHIEKRRPFILNFIRCIKKVLNVILGVLVTCTLAAGVLLVVPRAFGYRPYVVLSGSMEPNIHTGAVAYIDTKDTDLAPGDVAAFYESNGAVVTHRIVSGNETGGYTTKGDANDVEDMNIVPQENIIGTYKWSIPNLGYLISSLSAKTVTLVGTQIPSIALLMICIMAGLCILSAGLDSLERE